MHDQLDPFRRLMEEARRLSSTSTPYLAELGNRIRYASGGTFSPEDFAATSLAELLKLVPDLGAIEYDARGQPLFRFASRNRSAEGQPSSGTGPLRRIDRSYWSAVTDFHPPAGGYKLDLQSQRIVSSATVPQLSLDAEPERFLALPDAGQAFQLELARRFLAEHGADDAEGNQVLADRHWREAMDRWASQHGATWAEFRREAITRVILDWASSHGIPTERVAPRADAAPRPRPVRQVHQPHSRIRAWLHRAIEQMTDEELLALALPVRVLMLGDGQVAPSDRSRDPDQPSE